MVRTTDPTIFSIPKIHERSLFESRSYKVPQLKDIARHYGLRVSGRKSELRERICDFMGRSLAASKVQSWWSNHIRRRYILAKGPGYLRPKRCVNETDFFSLDDLAEVTPSQFFSYEDPSTKQVYGFDIRSLYQLFANGDEETPNPYTRQPFPSSVRHDLRFILRHAAMCETVPVEVELQEEEEISPEKRQEMRILALFQSMDGLGNYTDHRWFTDLGRVGLIKFIRELADIWSYRAQLPNEVKRHICPPMGDPFRGTNLLVLPSMSIFELRSRGVLVIERMITRGIDDAHRGLGVNYVLCALTLVNKMAADALPWLYQSVA